MLPRRFPSLGTPPRERMRYYPAVGPAIPLTSADCSRVTHPFAGCALRHPHDLHVLSTPPAFVLSQDQTLQEKVQFARPERGLRMSSQDHIRNHRIRVVSLPVAHESNGSTRSLARFTHSIVKQRCVSPQCFRGTRSIASRSRCSRAKTARRA